LYRWCLEPTVVLNSMRRYPFAIWQNGDTALLEATEFGNSAIVQALIGAEADPNLLNKVSVATRMVTLLVPLVGWC
jgi:ankyrin repeat protein